MRRRRGGSKGTWLPVLPTQVNEDDYVTYFNGTTQFPTGALDPGTELANGVIAIPLTMDETPQAGFAQNQSLRDWVEGQDYILRRVVGKVWCGLSRGEDTNSNVTQAIVCAALAVLPTDALQPNSPALTQAEFDPLNAQNVQQPWLWRRTWILENDLAVDSTPVFPNQTAAYGSVADGGHLDTKGTMRRVGKEQRIFIIFTARSLRSTTSESASYLQYGYDVRLFGAMRKGRNKSSFA